MGLKVLELWTVVLGLSAVVTAARNQDCPTPVIKNGFYKREQETLSHNTELYYSCDENFKTVEGTWWAAVTCQHGSWSSIPECIEDTACFDPQIPNANYTAFQYVNNNDTLWIRCNSGYADKTQHAKGICKNGEWEKLPVCERMVDSGCGPPPQIPNAVIVNHSHEDMFPEDAYAEYVCKSNFEMETNNNRTYCSYGQWVLPPSCRQKQGVDPLVTTASPISSGSDDNYKPLYTTVDKCGDPPPVQDGVVYFAENRMSVSYKCAHLYKLKGNSKVRCLNGHWTQTPICEDDFCKLDTSAHRHLVNIGDVYIKSGYKTKLDCFNSSWRTARAGCRDNQLFLSECCVWITHKRDKCEYSPINPSH